MTAALAAAVTSEQVSEVVLHQGRRVIGAKMAMIGLLVEDDKEVETRMMVGLAPEAVPDWVRMPISRTTVMTDAIRSGETILITSTSDYQAQYPDGASISAVHGVGPAAAAPLKVGQRILGGIVFRFAEERRFSADEVAFLEAIAGQTAQALERARLFRQVQEQADELHNRVGELQAILDTAPVAIWIAHDPESRVITGNAHADRIMMETARGVNVSRSALPGEAAVTYQVFRNGVELLPEELPAQLATATGKPVPPFEMELVFPGGRSLSLFEGAVPLFDATGQVRGAVVAGLDVTELHDVRERERRYLYTLAHNLRVPATIVKGNLDLLLETLPDDCVQPDNPTVGAIQRGLSRMSGMIDDFTLVMLLQAGEVTLHPEPVALASTVHAAIAQLVLTLDAARVTLDLPADLPPVQAEPKFLRIILQYLLENAKKFSAEGTPIRVAAHQQDGEVVISVADQGIGIAPDDLPRLFDRFYRVGHIRSAEGTGLGLFIVKQLVEMQGGRIWVESEVDRGSTFSFSIPTG